MLIGTSTRNGFVLAVYYDTNPLSPRKAFDHISTFVHWHPDYDLGEEQIERDPEIIEEYKLRLSKRGAIIMPLYLYDHSGITISTKPFGDPWDSGQVGFAYISRDTIKENWPNLNRIEQNKMAERAIIAEVEEFDCYITGNVVGYTISRMVRCNSCGHVENEEIDSCWGIYGPDTKQHLMGLLDKQYHEMVEEALQNG